MKKDKLNLCTSGLADAYFASEAHYVYTRMNGNPFFPDPVPPLTQLAGATEAFSLSLAGAKAGTHALVALKNEKRAQLEAIFVQLGLYVMYVANGNTEMLVSSGYKLSKQREPVYITNPGNVTLKNGVTSGNLESIVATVKGSKLYLHQITDAAPSADTVWDTRTCTRSKYTFKDLVPGQKYWVRVAATAASDQIAYSTVASQFVI